MSLTGSSQRLCTPGQWKHDRVTLHRSAVNNHIIHLVHKEPPHLYCCTPAHIHMDFFHKEKKNSVFYVCQIYTIGPVINNLFQLSSCEVQKVLPRSPTHKTLIFLRESGAARSDYSLSRQPDTDPILPPVTNQPVGLSEHMVLQNLSSLLLLALQLVWSMTHHIQDQQAFTKMNEVNSVKD